MKHARQVAQRTVIGLDWRRLGTGDKAMSGVIVLDRNQVAGRIIPPGVDPVHRAPGHDGGQQDSDQLRPDEPAEQPPHHVNYESNVVARLARVNQMRPVSPLGAA